MGVSGYLYPGQGSQKVGMGKDFYSMVLAVRPFFVNAEKLTGIKLLKLSFYGPAEELNQPVTADIAVFLNDVVAFEALKAKRLRPQSQFGEGPGLYAGLVAAEVLTLAEGLTLLKQRCELLQEEVKKNDGVMIQVLGLTESELQGLLAEASMDGKLEVATRVGDKHFIISGERNGLKKFILLAKAFPQCKAQGLTQGGAYHSSLLSGATEKMKPLLNGLKFQPIKISTINPSTGEYFYGVDEVKEYLVSEFAMPVEFEKSIQRMKQDGCFTLVETGPGQALGQWVRRIDRGIRILNCEDAKSLALTLKMAE